MKLNKILPILIFAVSAGSFSPNIFADYSLRCESYNKEYHTCAISTSGYVRLDRQLSNSRGCERGKSWDFTRRQIWVDKGCKAEFTIEDSYNDNNNSGSSSKKTRNAAIAIAGIAILGAILGSRNKDNNNNYDTKYDSNDYYGARHTSYVPKWITGNFRGYNNQYSSEVSMKINADGRVVANVNGEKIHGFYNDDMIQIGDYSFDVSRTPHGFETRQHGDFRNTVRYFRIN